MDDTKNINELAAALVKAQAKFPPIPKNKTANVGKYTYKYADLPDILDAVIPVLGKHGLAVMQRPDGDALVTALMHESGQVIEGRIPLPAKTSPQELGSWLTYLRRYSLTAMLGIAADEDDDAGSAQAAHSARRSQTVLNLTPQQIAEADTVERDDAFNDAIRNLYDVGVGTLIGRVDDPRSEMRQRFNKLLENMGHQDVREIEGREDQTKFYHAMRDMVGAIEREAQS